MVIGGPTPMELQGRQMKKIPAGGPVEAFQSGPSPAPAPASGTSTTGPSPASAPAPAPAPGATGSAPAPASSCDLKLTYNPNGSPVYTCDGKIVDSASKVTGGLPNWLKSATAKDGIDMDEAAIMNYWLANKYEDMPGWVRQFADAETLTDSEKSVLAKWAKDNLKTSQQVVVPTKKTSTSSTTTSSGKACKPKCPPKDIKCPPKTDKEKAQTCKGPIDMGDYIRKDSIPCWACSL